MTVVVGYVPTNEGKAALRRAVQEAQERAKRLIVIDSGQRPSSDETLPAALAEAEAAGIQYELRAPSHENDPAEDIIAAAEDANAALIVIGLRRRTPVGKLILGSNAQRVLLDAACPVLAVKGDPDA